MCFCTTQPPSPHMQTRQGLEHQENYHEFCRLLGRLRSNFQLSEIVSVENYESWIRAVAAFTVSSLQSWQLYSSSVTYLLQLWTRLVSCAAYLKGEQPNLLAELLPQIIGAYVQCRLESVERVAQVRSLFTQAFVIMCFGHQNIAWLHASGALYR